MYLSLLLMTNLVS